MARRKGSFIGAIFWVGIILIVAGSSNAKQGEGSAAGNSALIAAGCVVLGLLFCCICTVSIRPLRGTLLSFLGSFGGSSRGGVPPAAPEAPDSLSIRSPARADPVTGTVFVYKHDNPAAVLSGVLQSRPAPRPMAQATQQQYAAVTVQDSEDPSPADGPLQRIPPSAAELALCFLELGPVITSTAATRLLFTTLEAGAKGAAHAAASGDLLRSYTLLPLDAPERFHRAFLARCGVIKKFYLDWSATYRNTARQIARAVNKRAGAPVPPAIVGLQANRTILPFAAPADPRTFLRYGMPSSLSPSAGARLCRVKLEAALTLLAWVPSWDEDVLAGVTIDALAGLDAAQTMAQAYAADPRPEMIAPTFYAGQLLLPSPALYRGIATVTGCIRAAGEDPAAEHARPGAPVSVTRLFSVRDMLKRVATARAVHAVTALPPAPTTLVPLPTPGPLPPAERHTDAANRLLPPGASALRTPLRNCLGMLSLPDPEGILSAESLCGALRPLTNVLTAGAGPDEKVAFDKLPVGWVTPFRETLRSLEAAYGALLYDAREDQHARLAKSFLDGCWPPLRDTARRRGIPDLDALPAPALHAEEWRTCPPARLDAERAAAAVLADAATSEDGDWSGAEEALRLDQQAAISKALAQYGAGAPAPLFPAAGGAAAMPFPAPTPFPGPYPPAGTGFPPGGATYPPAGGPPPGPAPYPAAGQPFPYPAPFPPAGVAAAPPAPAPFTAGESDPTAQGDEPPFRHSKDEAATAAAAAGGGAASPALPPVPFDRALSELLEALGALSRCPSGDPAAALAAGMSEASLLAHFERVHAAAEEAGKAAPGSLADQRSRLIVASKGLHATHPYAWTQRVAAAFGACLRAMA